MPLIKNGAEIENAWSFVPDEAELSPDGCVVITLSRLLSQADLILARNTSVGVRLMPEDDPGLLADHLGRELKSSRKDATIAA